MEPIRIQKIIADSGYCSRRKAEEYIEQGLVKLNGHPVSIGDKANPSEDIITVAGEKIESEVTLRYIKMYKPRGYVTTMEDTHGRKIVTDLIHDDVKERVYPVGRLDRNSEGLLLLTNDGALANDIMHPRKHVEKHYRVTIPAKVPEEKLVMLSSGVEIGEGETTQPCKVNVLFDSEERTVLEFVIKEGKNRQIRRMCEAVGLNISRLRRTSEGGVKLGMLQPGEYKDLTKEELRALRAAIGKSDDRNNKKSGGGRNSFSRGGQRK